MSRFKNPRAASLLLLGSGLCFLLVAAFGWGRPLIVGMNALTAALMFVAAAVNARRARRDAA